MTAPSAAYVDASGRPRLQMSVAGFIDMLGFSNMSVSSNDEDELQQLLGKIVAAIEDSRSFVRDAMREYDTRETSTSWAIKYFSDNLVLGYPFEASGVDPLLATIFVLRCAQRYQLRMSLNGFFIRGALTQGLICLTDNIIFGPTLIEAYRLESSTAIVPRIVVTEPLQQRLVIDDDARPDSLIAGAGDLICRDVDGWWFVNYLQSARDAKGVNWDDISRHKESVLASLAVTTRHDVLPKFGWACRYHNVFCHWNRDEPGYSDRYRIDRIDEQSTIHRLGDIRKGDGA
jgi:hypothetical protein